MLEGGTGDDGHGQGCCMDQYQAFAKLNQRFLAGYLEPLVLRNNGPLLDSYNVGFETLGPILAR
jgi:hypothetical protein